MPKPSGWFSRRYQSNEAHLAAQQAKMERVQDQILDSIERDEAAKNRTPEEQLARLDKMLGKGKGAKKERARLKKKIQDRKNRKKKKKPEMAKTTPKK